MMTGCRVREVSIPEWKSGVGLCWMCTATDRLDAGRKEICSPYKVVTWYNTYLHFAALDATTTVKHRTYVV